MPGVADINKYSRVIFTRLYLLLFGNYFFFPLYSSETVNFARPFARRAANTRRPFFVAILSRKPCLFFLFLLEGWNVLFIVLYFYMFFVQKYFTSFSLQNYSFFLYWQRFRWLISLFLPLIFLLFQPCFTLFSPSVRISFCLPCIKTRRQTNLPPRLL